MQIQDPMQTFPLAVAMAAFPKTIIQGLCQGPCVSSTLGYSHTIQLLEFRIFSPIFANLQSKFHNNYMWCKLDTVDIRETL